MPDEYKTNGHHEDTFKLPALAWLTFVLCAGVSGYLVGTNSSTNSLQKLPAEQSAGSPGIQPHQGAGITLGEHTISRLAEEAVPWVVSIDVAANAHSFGHSLKTPFFFGPHMRPSPDFPRPIGRFGSGAGIVIKENGYILTNSHVIHLANEIRVTLADKREYMAQIIGRDRSTDLAVLKIDAQGLQKGKFGDSKKVKAGDWAVAIGSPMRLDHSVSLGIISALGRNIGDPLSSVDLIQTDAAINPGNSGGPLLNLAGEIIGINTVVRTDAQNISFAVPSNLALTIADKLIKEGKIIHNYIGIRMNDIPAQSLSEKNNKVIIEYVVENSPAKIAGLEAGDLIQSVDGIQVSSLVDVNKALHTHKNGDKIVITVHRHNLDRKIPVTIGATPEAFTP